MRTLVFKHPTTSGKRLPLSMCDLCYTRSPFDWYMVEDEVWRATGSRKGVLCIGHLEERLGRSFRYADIKAVPLNYVRVCLLYPDMESSFRERVMRDSRFTGHVLIHPITGFGFVVP